MERLIDWKDIPEPLLTLLGTLEEVSKLVPISKGGDLSQFHDRVLANKELRESLEAGAEAVIAAVAKHEIPPVPAIFTQEVVMLYMGYTLARMQMEQMIGPRVM